MRSRYTGDEACPRCAGMVWVLENWATLIAVKCAACHYRRGELKQEERAA